MPVDSTTESDVALGLYNIGIILLQPSRVVSLCMFVKLHQRTEVSARRASNHQQGIVAFNYVPGPLAIRRQVEVESVAEIE